MNGASIAITKESQPFGNKRICDSRAVTSRTAVLERLIIESLYVLLISLPPSFPELVSDAI